MSNKHFLGQKAQRVQSDARIFIEHIAIVLILFVFVAGGVCAWVNQ